ncbi:hypothetical protein Acor_72580 [Acrocarpospora corrugata]|uniref:Uncharacterized protein n=1 Tax=Acrocarpospora corrugata TaxID=35763 RepID=A0A5M3WAB6_9ACTN|nr:hypothetical protein Acor_72580 [Acrocarpospora corrugata]
MPQTHLATQLRGTEPARPTEEVDIDASTAERRAGLMTAMQRGWERGRRETGQPDLYGGRKDRTDG